MAAYTKKEVSTWAQTKFTSIIHFTFSYFYIFIALDVIKMTTTSWQTGAGAVGPSGDSNNNAQCDKCGTNRAKIFYIINYFLLSAFVLIA